MATSVDAKLLKQTKFPPEFTKKVDMQKVNIEVMKKWIAGKISEILGNEDDVVIELCFNLLEGSRFPDIKVLQIQLTGFLDKDTAKFCKELWNLCLSAQSNPQGVPKELLEAKKLELIQEKIDAQKAADQARHRQEQERTRDRDIASIRQRVVPRQDAILTPTCLRQVVVTIGLSNVDLPLLLPDRFQGLPPYLAHRQGDWAEDGETIPLQEPEDEVRHDRKRPS